MKKIILILTIVVAGLSVNAQQEVLVSQYMFNELYINPAYAGSHDFFDGTVLHRSQWVNFDGAPVTQLLEIEGPLMDRKLCVGLVVINDVIGDTKQLEFNGNISYHIDFDEARRNRLSLGLRLGASNYSAQLTKTEVFDADDPVFQQDITNELIPKIGVGAYYYGENKYFGISVPTFFSADKNLLNDIDSINYEDDFYFENHIFVTAGVIFPLNANLKLKPNVLVKYQQAAPVEIDIAANLLIKETVWIGAAYRTGDAIVAMLEANVTEQLRLGYAYDYTLTDILTYSSGSHEFMLGYRFGKEIIKTKSPRYF